MFLSDALELGQARRAWAESPALRQAFDDDLQAFLRARYAALHDPQRHDRITFDCRELSGSPWLTPRQ